jgi:hypothetical protein
VDATATAVASLTLSVRITHPEARRRAALLAGQALPASELREVALTPATPRWSVWVREVCFDFNDRPKLYQQSYESAADPTVPVPSDEQIVALLAAEIEADRAVAITLEIERDAQARAKAAALAAQAERWLAGEDVPLATYGLEPSLRDRVEAEQARRKALATAASAASRAKLVARLEALVRETGNAGAIERLDADRDTTLGLLPESEALEIVTDARLPLAPGLDAYRRLTVADAHQQCGYYYDSHAGFEQQAFESAADLNVSASTWERAKRVRAALVAYGVTEPGTIREHTATCTDRSHDGESRASRAGLLVVLDLGDGVEIRREYGLDGGDS